MKHDLHKLSGVYVFAHAGDKCEICGRKLIPGTMIDFYGQAFICRTCRQTIYESGVGTQSMIGNEVWRSCHCCTKKTEDGKNLPVCKSCQSTTSWEEFMYWGGHETCWKKDTKLRAR